MEWYYYLIIGYVLVILVSYIFTLRETRIRGFGDFIVTILIFFLALLVAPIVMLFSNAILFGTSITYFKTFTIPPLTDSNKTTLTEMGFMRVDNFTSINNIEYSGYRWGDICVQDNGRVFATYSLLGLNRRHKQMLETIKYFKYRTKYEGEKESNE
jgi:hypothetical protein